jgi:hypothetical protein
MNTASHASTQALLDELGRQLGGVGGAVDAQTPPSTVLDPSQPHGGPLGDLESIARSRGLACWLRRMRVVDAVWLASTETPIVGWPAVQFVGWPSVAVGTFGGEVMSIDAVDDGAGRFRIVIRPDPEDAPWPGTQYLRQGVRVKAWVLLRTVPLWQEVWRQLNGFPPVVAPKEPAAKKDPEA